MQPADTKQPQRLPRLYSTTGGIAPEEVHEMWRQKKRAQLKREPHCRRCLESGIEVAASVATHVKPLFGNVEVRTFLHSALQSLCEACSEAERQSVQGEG